MLHSPSLLRHKKCQVRKTQSLFVLLFPQRSTLPALKKSQSQEGHDSKAAISNEGISPHTKQLYGIKLWTSYPCWGVLIARLIILLLRGRSCHNDVSPALTEQECIHHKWQDCREVKFLFNICLYANAVWKQSSLKLHEKKKREEKNKRKKKNALAKVNGKEVKQFNFWLILQTFSDLICTAIRDLKRPDV